MSYKAEQIGRDRRMLARKAAARASRYAKRAEHRLSRRAAKADPENAPTRRQTHGYLA